MIAALSAVFAGCATNDDDNNTVNTKPPVVDNDDTDDKDDEIVVRPTVPENYGDAFKDLVSYVRRNAGVATPSTDGMSYVYTKAVSVQSGDVKMVISLIYNDANTGGDDVGIVYYNYDGDEMLYSISTIFNEDYEKELTMLFTLESTGAKVYYSIVPMNYYENTSVTAFTLSGVDTSTQEGKLMKYSFHSILTSSTDLFVSLMEILCGKVGGDMTMENIGFSVYDKNGTPEKTTDLYSYDSDVVVNEGMSAQLEVNAYPCKSDPGKLNWVSSNTSVATVDSNGLVKGVRSGTAVITVSAGSVKTTFNVSVKDSEAAKFASFAIANSGAKFDAVSGNMISSTTTDTPYCTLSASKDGDATVVTFTYYKNKSTYAEIDEYGVLFTITIDGSSNDMLDTFLAGTGKVYIVKEDGGYSIDTSQIKGLECENGKINNFLFTNTTFFKSLNSAQQLLYLVNSNTCVNEMASALSQVLYANLGFGLYPSTGSDL